MSNLVFVPGMSASLYLLDRDSYDAGVDGDMDAFVPDEDRIDLDKAWHAIHYLVTGDAELGFLTTGVELPGVSETCELHSPDAIKDLARRLGSATTQDLMKQFDPETFNTLDIYGGPWDASAAGYIEPLLDTFLTTLRKAMREQCGLFVVIA